jgi:Transposase DDE domain group 1
MSDEKALIQTHPEGEASIVRTLPPEAPISVDTYAGKIQVKWVPEAAVSSLGLMAFFIEFLKTSGRFEKWVEQCPLQYSSPNAPQKRDVLGTLLLAVLAGHWRYAHINAIRGDGVNPELLGMSKVCSEDSVRRALLGLKEDEGEKWLQESLKSTYGPLLEEPWALDMDSTVKPLYGHQEDAKLGYNPSKPGRPSHVYHSYFLANLRIVLDVEVQAGNQTASSFAQPELWRLLDELPEASRPAFLRGDCNWGSERAMQGAEQRNVAYVFKLKQTANVRKLLERLFGKGEWGDAGQQWQGLSTELRLSGWSRTRRVVVLRRALSEARQQAAARKERKRNTAKQLILDLPELTHGGVRYEYAVLVTSMQDEVRAIAQHYRDRGDSENNFDELKNQWAWAGFTTQDRKRCQMMARITALIYNWWTIFMRLGIPDKHAEAVSSRPLALHGIARRIRHSNQTTVEVTSTHSRAGLMARALRQVSGFLKRIKATAEQLTQADQWRLILSAAFKVFLRGKVLGSTARLAKTTA